MGLLSVYCLGSNVTRNTEFVSILVMGPVKTYVIRVDDIQKCVYFGVVFGYLTAVQHYPVQSLVTSTEYFAYYVSRL